MRYWVYVHTNKVNGKKYVGTTTKDSPEDRWLGGLGYSNNIRFSSDIERYGWDNFDHEVISVNSKEQMEKLESYLCKMFDSYDLSRGYNCTSDGKYKTWEWVDGKRESSKFPGYFIDRSNRIYKRVGDDYELVEPFVTDRGVTRVVVEKNGKKYKCRLYSVLK